MWQCHRHMHTSSLFPPRLTWRKSGDARPNTLHHPCTFMPQYQGKGAQLHALACPMQVCPICVAHSTGRYLCKAQMRVSI